MNTKLGYATVGLQLVLLFLMLVLYMLNPDGKSEFARLVIQGSLAVIVVTTIGLMGSVIRNADFSAQ